MSSGPEEKLAVAPAYGAGASGDGRVADRNLACGLAPGWGGYAVGPVYGVCGYGQAVGAGCFRSSFAVAAGTGSQSDYGSAENQFAWCRFHMVAVRLHR